MKCSLILTYLEFNACTKKMFGTTTTTTEATDNGQNVIDDGEGDFDIDLRAEDSASFAYKTEEKDQYYCGATVVSDRFDLQQTF